MLFSKETYVERRRKLRELVGSGLIVLFGNNDSPNNYPSNVYKFRQDSAFLYFFGQHRNGLVGVIDADSGNEVLIGDDIDIDDMVWFSHLGGPNGRGMWRGRLSPYGTFGADGRTRCDRRPQGALPAALPP